MQEVSPEKENEEVEATAEENTSTEEVETAEVVEGEIEFDEEDDEDTSEEYDDDEEEDDELEEALDRIEKLEEENAALRARALRAQADAENFKKRNERERAESVKFANKRVFIEMLNVLDNFDRALISVADPKDNFVIGVQMIHKQLMEVLNQNGVEEINAVGRQFDPYLDEALAQEVTTEHPEGTVMEVFLKGYRYQGQLLRATKVKVAAAGSESANADTDAEDSSEETPELDTEA